MSGLLLLSERVAEDTLLLRERDTGHGVYVLLVRRLLLRRTCLPLRDGLVPPLPYLLALVPGGLEDTPLQGDSRSLRQDVLK